MIVSAECFSHNLSSRCRFLWFQGNGEFLLGCHCTSIRTWFLLFTCQRLKTNKILLSLHRITRQSVRTMSLFSVCMMTRCHAFSMTWFSLKKMTVQCSYDDLVMCSYNDSVTCSYNHFVKCAYDDLVSCSY